MHESNHFVRRFIRIGQNISETKTSEHFFTKEGKEIIENLDDTEGGEIMSKILFGKNLITLNIFQILYLLNLNNWNQNRKEFHMGFSRCKNLNVDEHIANLKNLFKEDFTDEINELVQETLFSRSESQMSYQNIYEEKSFVGVELGRCMISIGRENDPDYNV